MSENEPNAFLKEQIQRETDEALRKATAVPPPVQKQEDEDEDKLFEAHMRRFPGQHE